MAQFVSSAPRDQNREPASGSRAPLASSAANYLEVVRALAAVQKPIKGAPAYSRFINRRLGRLIAAQAFRLGMTPNSVTAISATFSFAGILLLAIVRPNLGLGIAVCACLVVGYAFDAADGQLARLRGGGTPSGEWLDHIIDATKISSLHLAVLVSAYRFLDLPAGWLLVPIGFTVVAAVMFFGMTLNDQLRRQQEARSGKAIERGSTSLFRSLSVIPTDYGLLCVVFVLLAVPHLFFWVYALLFFANAGFMALAYFKWFRDMKVLD